MQRRRPTTGTLTTIGDLPVDLRAGVRRRLWQYGLATLVVTAAIAITASVRAPEVPSRVDPSQASSRIAAAPAAQHRADPLPTEQSRVDPPSRVGTRPTSARQPAPVESLRDEACDPPTCARHGNERECCAPFRAAPLPEALDRAMVEAAIEAVKPAIIACAAGTTSEGTIRIAVDVGGTGRVAHTAVDEAPEASVAQCIAAALRTARFTATQHGATFAYRYELP